MTQRAPNRLIYEQSPYLLQHAHNPVDWYPWGEEAFNKAKADDKPIFLSIGYSTCHWCHVMARESFADEEIAGLLNERFISIKVDREERPDIDAIYMQACQAIAGQGGWPLSVFLTPDKKPFYAGTYFPPEGRYGRPGFRELVVLLSDQYKAEPEKIDRVAQKVAAVLQPRAKTPGELEEADTHSCFHQLQKAFDEKYGGFGSAPKFPTPHNLMFLLRYHRWSKNPAALEMVAASLDAMANGGIYDHLGYGFCRYSTDRQWLIPHFEKMLYDNALLAIAYTEGWQVTGQQRYMTVAREILDYCDRALTGPEGSFLSAEDADSEGVEGKFYAWEQEEVMAVLGQEQGILFCEAYNITEKGNFEGKNIPNLIDTDLTQVANFHNVEPDLFKSIMESCRHKLFIHREERVHPHKDDKVLTSWNALMIAALALAARAFGEDKFLQRAKEAYEFIEDNLTESGRLLARWRQGEARYKAYIDDYAYLLWACNELYAASLDITWLTKAKELASQMQGLFWDEENGGFYFYGHDGEELISRPKEIYDGALPSGNSVAARELIRLARLTGDPEQQALAEGIFTAFAGQVKHHPAGHGFLLQALLQALVPGKEAVVVGDLRQPETRQLLSQVQRSFLPEVSLLAAAQPQELDQVAPFAAGIKPSPETRVYLCQNYACGLPETDIAKVLTQLLL
ncbi:MAG: thioredoxin domain-containing protein [Eubacteriales bacterium]|nr:thioredoxin domain-containing protein [Eubacteriales bacterium]